MSEGSKGDKPRDIIWERLKEASKETPAIPKAERQLSDCKKLFDRESTRPFSTTEVTQTIGYKNNTESQLVLEQLVKDKFLKKVAAQKGNHTHYMRNKS